MEEVPGHIFRDNFLIFRLNFETKGTYLITFTVTTSYVVVGAGSEFVINANGTRKTFLVKKAGEWQRLNMIVEVPKPGAYGFSLYLEGKPENDYNWSFHSCEVTAWKKWRSIFLATSTNWTWTPASRPRSRSGSMSSTVF